MQPQFGNDGHIKMLRLFDLARKVTPAIAEEARHLFDCRECREVVEIFERQCREQNSQDNKRGAAAGTKKD